MVQPPVRKNDNCRAKPRGRRWVRATIAVLTVCSSLCLGTAIGVKLVKGGFVPIGGDNRLEHFSSRRMAALSRQLVVGDVAANKTVIDEFWQQLLGKGPMIEPVDGDPHSSWITFVWKGDDKTRSVLVLNGPSSSPTYFWLTRLGNTDLWYRTERIANDARFVYTFQINWPAEPPKGTDEQMKLLKYCPFHTDPTNPRTAKGPPRGSVVELSEAPPQPWLQPVAGVAKGTLSVRTLDSRILNQKRRVSIYTPSNYSAGDPSARLLVLFDGDSFITDDGIPTPTILDNLIAQKQLPPMVAAVVHQTARRDQELECSDPFADFTAKELVPWLRQTYGLSSDPKNTLIGGMSTGGMMAAYCGYRHPEIFGNVLSLSGTFYWYPGFDEGTAPPDTETGWLTRQFVKSPYRPLRFCVALGRFEAGYPINSLIEGRRFRDALEAKGYSIRYREYTGAHEVMGWRGPFVEGLIALTATDEKSEPK
jgi:enterochelin esterase-like enzyme